MLDYITGTRQCLKPYALCLMSVVNRRGGIYLRKKGRGTKVYT